MVIDRALLTPFREISEALDWPCVGSNPRTAGSVSCRFPYLIDQINLMDVIDLIYLLDLIDPIDLLDQIYLGTVCDSFWASKRENLARTNS